MLLDTSKKCIRLSYISLPLFTVQQYVKSWLLQIFLEYLQEISIRPLNLKQLAEAIVHIDNARTV